MMSSDSYSASVLSRAAGVVGRKGLIVGVLILILVSLLLVPLPRPLLDVLLVVNFVVALTLLLVGLFFSDSKQLYTFPTILLLTTLFRLALNVSSTRLILLNGDQGLDAAGEVIEAFGSFVVQGDFVVGAIIFGIIAIVNFVVIAKGAARVAEVSARFALDALPGRQLAIDSDLRAGNINKAEASGRRAVLSRESEFYGSMDGAMKFVQGDAIAGFVITFINAVGGVSIGLGRGMDFLAAVDTFGVLTIGDGLVSILPSLLISVCAGVVVTRVSSHDRSNVKDDSLANIIREPRALIVAGVILLLLGLVPGIPIVPFYIVGIFLLTWTWASFFWGSNLGVETYEEYAVGDAWSGMRLERPELERPALSYDGESVEAGLRKRSAFRILNLQVDAKVIAAYLEDRSGESLKALQQHYSKLQSEFFLTRGIHLPDVSIAVSEELSEGQYSILVREQLFRTAGLDCGLVFTAVNASQLRTLGFTAEATGNHPLTHCSCSWIENSALAESSLQHLGAEVLSPAQFLALEAASSALASLEEIFGLEEVKQLIAGSGEDCSVLLEEIFGAGVVSYAEFTDLLRRLAKERVSVRDLKLILDGVAEFHSYYPEPEHRQDWLADLHAFLRRVLLRGIMNTVVGVGGELRAFVLSERIEEEFRDAVHAWDRNRSAPPLDPDLASRLRRSAGNLFTPVLERGAAPVVVMCSGDIRAAVEDFFSRNEGAGQWLRTLAFEELQAGYKVESVGILEV